MWDDVANVATESKGEQTMKTKYYTTSFTVDQSPDEVFDSITNVRGWWSEEIDGSTDKPGAVYVPLQRHSSRQKTLTTAQLA
jgi:hypothetical protein